MSIACSICALALVLTRPAAAAAHVVIYAGQSNCTGVGRDAAPQGLPDARARLWSTVVGASDADNFGPLTLAANGTHGAEIAMARRLLQTWKDVVIVKVCHNGSAIKRWVSGSKRGDGWLLRSELRQARSQLPSNAIWHFVWNQGEAEATRPRPAPANAWAMSFRRLVGALQQTLATKLHPVIVRTHARLNRGYQLAIVREQQQASGGVVVDQDDLPLADGTHLSGAAQNALGKRIAEALLAPAG